MDKPRKPTDINEMAKSIVDQATGQIPKVEPPKKSPAAVARGRKGGKKGGIARAATLTSNRRSEIASQAARKRWKINQKKK